MFFLKKDAALPESSLVRNYFLNHPLLEGPLYSRSGETASSGAERQHPLSATYANTLHMQLVGKEQVA